MWVYRLYEFLFDRWTVSILEEGEETWCAYHSLTDKPSHEYKKHFVKYKLTHKFNGSVKIKIKYLNQLKMILLRCVFCPILFFIILGAMSLFLGPICFFLGLVVSIGKVFGGSKDDSYKDMFFFTFAWIILPVMYTGFWIQHGTLPEDF